MEEFRKTLIDFKDTLENVKGTCEKLVQSKLSQLQNIEEQVKDLADIAKKMDEDKKATIIKKMEELKQQVINDGKTIREITSFVKQKEYY